MKKVLNVLMWIVFFPVYLLLSPLSYIYIATDKRIRLGHFLSFGRDVIGGYSGKLRVGTTHKKEDIIFETDGYNTMLDNFQCGKESQLNKYLLEMKVYDFRIDEEGYLHIKVFTNEKLLKKCNDTLVNRAEEGEK